MIRLRGKRATFFGNIKTLERVHGYQQHHVSFYILITKIIIVSLLFLVATGSVELRSLRPVSDTDYVILIDASASMSKTDYNPSRLSAAKEISYKWLSVVPNGTRIGLIGFSEDLSVVDSPTTDLKKIKSDIDGIKIDYSKSGTSLIFAISNGVSLLNKTPNKKALLLLTDGTDEIDNNTVAYAIENNVKIYAFGIGSKEGQAAVIDPDIPDEFKDLYTNLDYNFSKLEDLSIKTGGKAYSVSNTDELATAFRQVTLENANVQLNSSYYIVLLIAFLSILELIVYSKFGGI